MNSKPEHPTVRDFERELLRKGWWLFPVLGALASLAIGGPFWEWVEGNSPFPLHWERLFSLRAAGLALAFLAVPGVWRLALRWKVPRGLALFAALLLAWGLDAGLQTRFVQIPFWLAARPRLDSTQYFMREVCYVRLEETTGRADSSPAVIVMGSSQVLHGVDEQLLRELLRPRPVIRRAMFGMTPLNALAFLAYVSLRPGDTCLMYRSEFDFTNQTDYPFAWFRPYGSWRTLPEVWACISPAVRWNHWRELVDTAMAATLESWRMRDFSREIAFHFWGRTPDDRRQEASREPAAAADGAKPEHTDALVFSPAQQRAFVRTVELLDEAGVQLVLFEGDVHPALYSENRFQAREKVRQWMQELAQSHAFSYLPLAEQGLDLGPEHWLDTSHLNDAGSERLTRRMARELQAADPPADSP